MQFFKIFTKSSFSTKILYYSFYLITFFYLLYLGPIKIGRDSFHYLDNSVIRSPIYPFFLDVYSYIFGDWYRPLIAINFVFAIFAIFFFLKTLTEKISLPDTIIFIFSVILLTPYFFGDYKFANRILTEGLCYPLYIIGISFFLKYLFQKDYKSFFCFLFCLFFLVLTRRQFLFLYPVIIFMIFYLFFVFKDKKKLLVSFFTFILIALSAEIFERYYRYVKYENFSAPPFFGIQFLVAPLYLSEKKDENVFENIEERKTFNEFFSLMELKMANIKDFKNSRNSNFYHHYMANYNIIAWNIIHKNLNERNFNWFEIDEITSSMGFKLIINDPIKHLKLYFFGLKQMFGGYYLMVFYMMTFLFAIIFSILKKDRLAFLLLFSYLCSFSNFILVSIVEVPIMRYSIYTEVIQIIVFQIIFYGFFVRIRK